MRYLGLELGAFFGFFLMLTYVLRAANSIRLQQELSDLTVSKFRSAKYKVEQVISYEEFVKMRLFIQRVKQNAEIRALLRNDPRTSDILIDDSDDEEIGVKVGSHESAPVYEALDTNGSSGKRKSHQIGMARSPIASHGALLSGVPKSPRINN